MTLSAVRIEQKKKKKRWGGEWGGGKEDRRRAVIKNTQLCVCVHGVESRRKVIKVTLIAACGL